MAQIHKLEDQRGRKCSGEKFYEIFRKKANLLPQICPDLVKDIKVVKGDWESKDSTKQWTIVVAGKLPEVDVMAESADDDNKSYTYIVIDGEIKKHYIFLKTTFKVTTNPIHSLDHGCWVKLTIEYEPNPHSREKPTEYLDFYISVMNAVEEYLLRNP
ncbi:thebaine synthase 2-like [Corylus avellana]|uniref:thebaine synthase 2-like n=1 Tax=Corylus avellana TaxID=13451 RepID=UPI00286AE769|nr:thebaine synthase 2-like [Corylus avellana]